LAKKGLTAAAGIANFHQQRVIPLMERRLAIFELTPKAAAKGLRTSSVLLSLEASAQRAKSAVAHFPSDPEDLWKIKMRPEKGYISLVSLAFDCCRFRADPSPSSCFGSGSCLQGLSHKGYVSKPLLPEVRKANRLHTQAY
jgi:hypothetical protein